MRTKIIVIFTILFLTLFSFSGCNKQDKPTESSKDVMPQKTFVERTDSVDYSIQYLFTQSADTAVVSTSEGVHTLTLKGVNKGTVYFSDRPARKYGAMDNKDFVEDWNQGNNNFKADPPNALLSVVNKDGEQITIVIELSNPRFENNDLLYDFTFLNPDGAQRLPDGIYFDASLFIDGDGLIHTKR